MARRKLTVELVKNVYFSTGSFISFRFVSLDIVTVFLEFVSQNTDFRNYVFNSSAVWEESDCCDTRHVHLKEHSKSSQSADNLTNDIGMCSLSALAIIGEPFVACNFSVSFDRFRRSFMISSIRRNIHQGHEVFSHYSRGRQYAFMSVAALLFSRSDSIDSWTQANIDEISYHGDCMYLHACIN